jgi:tetratricopeptide (TPR) repeat protein
VCAAVLALCQAASLAQTPPAETWAALDAEAMDWYGKGDLPRAIEAADAALRRAASPRETGRSLDRLGFLYYTSGKLEEGERYLRQSLQSRESAFGAIATTCLTRPDRVMPSPSGVTELMRLTANNFQSRPARRRRDRDHTVV